jgi:glycosyltransferase involved in cell wall biosynthesis
VLHDFFLSGALNWMDTLGLEPGVFQKALFASHGIEAVEEERSRGRDAALIKYPANRFVLQRATGVIVHSRYSVRAAERWYGRGFSRDWRLIPHLRAVPASIDRAQARAALGLGPDDFLVCSFGHVNRTKLNHRLVDAWTQSSLASDPQCRLVFVGNARPPYGDTVQQAMRRNPLAGQITITGYADRALYERYLCAADLAVQLRTMSRGETSGAVLDCLGFGVPVLANANGSNAEYPPHVLHMLADEFTDDQLIDALERLRRDPLQRRAFSQAGREWIQVHHHPQTVAQQYRDAIEHFAAEPANTAYWQAVDTIAALGLPAEEDLEDAAIALAATTRGG